MKKKKESQHLFLIISLFVKSILVYFLILIVFACLFLHSGGLCITGDDITANSFFDCLYFSFITFHTIGYGDIIPDNDEAKRLIMILSSISLICTTLFAGIIIDAFIKQREEIKKIPLQQISLVHLFDIIYPFCHPWIPSEYKSSYKTPNKVPDIKYHEFGGNYSIEESLLLEGVFNKKSIYSIMKFKIRRMLDKDVDNIQTINDEEQHIEDKYCRIIEGKLDAIKEFNKQLYSFSLQYGTHLENEVIYQIMDIQKEIKVIFENVNYKVFGVERYENACESIVELVIKTLKLRQKIISFSN